MSVLNDTGVLVMPKHCIAAMILTAAALAPLSLAPLSTAHAQGARIGPARAAAIHECSLASQRYPETTFSSLEFELYRACMTRHGQVE
jgi:hypothetical protein